MYDYTVVISQHPGNISMAAANCRVVYVWQFIAAVVVVSVIPKFNSSWHLPTIALSI